MNSTTRRFHVAERRRAAASIKWPAKTSILVNPDPAVRKRLVRAGALVAALLVFVAVDPGRLWSGWQRSAANDRLKPAMEASMAGGSHAAAAWLAIHYAEEFPGLLQREADAGEPTAMFMLGRLLQTPHPERFLTFAKPMSNAEMHAKGALMIRQAAAAGNQDALVSVVGAGRINPQDRE